MGGPNYANDLAKVFDAASTDFQNTLCTLDAVYINAVQCTNQNDPKCFGGSWGWWQSKPVTPNGRIVALSTALWAQPSYSNYETELTQTLLPSSGVAYSNAQSCSSSGVCLPVDNLTTALLAALAHEVGHIGWYVEVNPLSDPTSYCAGKFFASSWKVPVHRPPPDDHGFPWRHLLTLSERDNLRNSHRWNDIHKVPPHIDVIDHPGAGDPAPKKSILDLLNVGQPWASLFAAMSPDEDFVETYKFKVMTTAKAPLTSVTITVPQAGTANIVADYTAQRKLPLMDKVDCVRVSF